MTIYYFSARYPIESLNRLILIYIMIFLLYLTCFILIIFVVTGSQNTINYLFYLVVLSGLYYYYAFLLIPLIGIIALTIYYLRLNIPIGNKKLSITLILLTLIIFIFIGIYSLLNWSIGLLDASYPPPEWD
ncbi:MAG: hypothetical protein ACFFDX_12220 [Candidatus Odinarchaeota archaeon]